MFIMKMTAQEFRNMKAKKPNKYKNVESVSDGITFDSVKEKKRYYELLTMQNNGLISELNRQIKYELIPVQKDNGKVIERAVCYYADFTYQTPDGLVVEDVKSEATRKLSTYIIKRKLMLFVQGIKINEI